MRKRKTVFFSKIGNDLLRGLNRKKTHVFFSISPPKSNARAHLKQGKHSGLMGVWQL